MIRKIQAVVGLTIFVACTTATQAPKAALKAAVPASQSQPVVDTLHGVTVTDPYRWLEDQEAPATRDWIARQNAYTDAMSGYDLCRAQHDLMRRLIEQAAGRKEATHAH